MSEPKVNLWDRFKKTLGFFCNQIILVAVALAIATILISVSGFEPTAVWAGIGSAVTQDIFGTLRWFTPLVFTGLACAVAFKAGIWNMGVDGQLYMGTIIGTAVALKLFMLPAWLLLPLVMICGVLFGMLWALVAGFLRVYCGAKEVVTTILLNYIAFNFSDYLVLEPLKGSGAYAAAQSSDIITEKIWLPIIVPETAVHIGIFVAVLMAVVLFVIFIKTKFGYEMKMLGTNRAFANYGGINIKKRFLMTIAISGAIAGLAGIIEILGIHHRFPFRFSSNLGFDGIVVAILANNDPLGVLLSAGFFSILRNGSYNIERLSDVPRSLVLVVQAMIIILAGIRFSFGKNKSKIQKFIQKFKRKTL